MNNALEDIDTKRELKLRDVKSLDKAKEVISKMDDIKKEIESEKALASIHRKSYAEITKEDNRFKSNDFQFKQNSRNNMNQFNSDKNNNGLRTFRQNENIGNRRFNNFNSKFDNKFRFSNKICWCCGDEGHIKRFCPKLQCNLCNRRGHFRNNCWFQDKRYLNDERNVWKQRESSKKINALNSDPDIESRCDDKEDMDDVRNLNARAPILRETIGAINAG